MFLLSDSTHYEKQISRPVPYRLNKVATKTGLREFLEACFIHCSLEDAILRAKHCRL